jgi:hypothetical protein
VLAIRRIEKPLREILAGPDVSAETEIECKRILRPLVVWQEMPTVAIPLLSGVYLPVHERIMLDVGHRGAINNVFVGSRGTSKTSTMCVLYSGYKSTLWSTRKAITLSASGFRGGQLIFNEFEKWATNAWDDQEADVPFIEASMRGESLVKRSQNYWQIHFSSESSNLTLPTNDPEKLRGNRANDLYLDERNFMDEALVDKVADSFTNVTKGIRSGGEDAEANYFFLTTTVDYGWREFDKTRRGAYEGLRRELEALTALEKRDFVTYRALEKQKLHRTSYVCLDYTDTIIRRHITTRDGRRFEVVWPDTSRKWRAVPEGIPYTECGADGRIKQLGSAVEVITTYPINREELEGKLLAGQASEAVWLSEQRNVVDSSAGDVYPHLIVDQAVCKGSRYLLPWSECGTAYKRHFPDERHFVPPVLWSTTDPCVLGVDYAPGNRDFCAFVVIRIGPLAAGEFNPLTGEGKTTWSNVVWVEQHRNATGENVAEKIRAFAQRYNLVYFHDPYETDTWKLCRAVGLDVRGGGNAVRDALVFINQETLGDTQFRILDPLDDDPRLAAFKMDTAAKPMLDAIKPTGQLNDKLVEFTLGQMQQRLLYLPADVKLSERPMDRKYDIGYDGARILEHQLRALQQAPTASGYRKFFMNNDEENKKDAWAAFIYAAKQLRAHLLRIRLMEDAPPPLGAVVTQLNKNRGHGGRAVGARAFG